LIGPGKDIAMTVAELIAELSKHDPQARVVVIDNSTDTPTPFPVQTCTEYEPGEITIEY
jgi:hypothetical protein